MRWIAKAIVQKGISFLPQAERINLLFQKYVTKGVLLDDRHFRYKLEAARDHLRFFSRKLTEDRDLQILELGTGWYPVVPLAFYLVGAGGVTSIDIRDWTSTDNHLLAFRKFLEWYDDGRLQTYLPDVIEARIDLLRRQAQVPGGIGKAELNRLIGLTTLTVDARRTGFADDSFDLICSNNTFEHVYADVLRDILREFKRIARPGAMMSHFIDLSDHFAHFDPSITIYNFLKFSDRQWRMIDNDIQPQNRLRWPEYMEMYREQQIPVTQTAITGADVQALRSVDIDERWQRYSAEDLAISHGYVITEF